MIVFMIVGMMTSAAHATCRQGVYRSGSAVVALVPDSNAPSTQRYLFLDGRRGSTADAAAPVKCSAGSIAIERGEGRVERPTEVPMKTTDTTFSSVATVLKGRLIEPVEESQRERPLVVMVHGSERTSALNSVYAYMLAAQDISVFVYDKRGTGGSEGEYTQNFELLAADAAAALAHARTMMRGRFERSGYFGGSQGGWVAPLAATRSGADFVAVGFGLVASPIEEDREQMFSEARALGLGEEAIALLDRLSRATARLLLTDFKQGYEELAKVRSEMTARPWLERIRGEYSGAMLRMSEEELRRVGRPRFDNVELIWDYDSIATLQRLDAPLLWVLAEDDREAPIETTRAALLQLIEAGKPIDVYVFPDTDHGMMEYVTNADGSRKSTRITEGYLRLLGDWIKGDVADSYGRGERIGHD
jgi:pimeloyl-ACP methyl ester carboxylesterase